MKLYVKPKKLVLMMKVFLNLKVSKLVNVKFGIVPMMVNKPLFVNVYFVIVVFLFNVLKLYFPIILWVED
eukprot:CAMPEP_0201551492 /NCGR_PEP_ID=MMETSP0173_2-20130828/7660_1 /ASSEMBLY_ACC=CAM_ASM_000268 /TAXON_ID=218659 /ORGANISM="Vexillifera sp., Strain DIVA3 564/2" /LENGTH=69 /DNA_ID=CAMNT_0047961767 /DNA_START=186 /DNA_END=395 /DNA_ORIENTATION=+